MNRITSPKTLADRIARTIHCLVSLEKAGCWLPAMRQPLLRKLAALLARKAELAAK
jgi:hypothetical protein